MLKLEKNNRRRIQKINNYRTHGFKSLIDWDIIIRSTPPLLAPPPIQALAMAYMQELYLLKSILFSFYEIQNMLSNILYCH